MANKSNLRINIQRVEELISKTSLRPTTEGRFRFNLSAQDALDLLAAAYRAEVEERLRDFILDDNTEANLIELAEYITQKTTEFGVMCCGTCGNGKTTLIYAFRRAVYFLWGMNHFSFLSTPEKCFSVDFRVYHAKDIVRIAKDESKYKDIRNCPMLAIDDLGTEPTEIVDYGNVLSPIVDLIEHRYNNQLFTFITTNLVAKSSDDKVMTIRKKYGTRIADRFNEMLRVIIFRDISYRCKK